ncbi:MAG: tetratricopeptide repeat protein, partial [Nostocales cyanobacterium ELA608]
MPVISNTSPLLNLAIIDQLDLLRQQFGEILIPKAVLEELRVEEILPGSDHLREALVAGWLQVREVNNPSLVQLLQRDLDRGEAEAIALALLLDADWIILDERDGRRIAKSFGLQVTGILGVVIRASRNGQISSLPLVINQLREEAGFHIAQNLLSQILKEETKSMNYKYTIPAALIGVSIALVQPQIAFALSSGEVAKIAKQITVLIDSKSPGSGIIVKRSGNTYTVLTAGHVVASKNKAEIVTPDGKRYQLNYSTVKPLPGVDLATFQFTSSNNYPVAKIGNSDQSREGTIAYVAGFPKAKASSISSSIYIFTDGKINANTSKPLKDGYALAYSNITLPGMSGGPLFNEQGELIGVHGRSDESEVDIETSKVNPEVAYIKSGFNLGIPINTFLRLSAKSGVDVGVTPPPERVATAPKADDFFIQGVDKQRKGDKQGAILAYNDAIKINPNFSEAYIKRGNARDDLGDKQGAIEDYNQALKINPNYAKAYYNRGTARYDLGDKQSAIADYNQAIKINPYYTDAYNNRGIARSNLGDNQGAIADFNQALKLNPYYIKAYINRGNARSNLGDNQEAIADFNQVIKIIPDEAYMGRGIARYQLGDKQGAIADFNQALKINPNYANAYYNRGNARYRLGDKQGAIADFNQALKIN